MGEYEKYNYLKNNIFHPLFFSLSSHWLHSTLIDDFLFFFNVVFPNIITVYIAGTEIFLNYLCFNHYLLNLISNL